MQLRRWRSDREQSFHFRVFSPTDRLRSLCKCSCSNDRQPAARLEKFSTANEKIKQGAAHLKKCDTTPPLGAVAGTHRVHNGVVQLLQFF
jgi:hypothetical protein